MNFVIKTKQRNKQENGLKLVLNNIKAIKQTVKRVKKGEDISWQYEIRKGEEREKKKKLPSN